MRRIGVATLALIATGCSILIDSSQYTGGDGSGDAGPDATADGAIDGANDGAVECVTDDDCDARNERCDRNECIRACTSDCMPGVTYCGEGDRCLACDEDSDGFTPRPRACPGPDVVDCDDHDPLRHPGAQPRCGNDVIDDCETFPLTVEGYREVGRLRPQHVADFDPSMPVQLSVSAGDHVLDDGVEPYEAIAVFQSGIDPTVAGFDIDPDPKTARWRDPQSRRLLTRIVASSVSSVAVGVDDIGGIPHFAVVGPVSQRVELFSGLLAGEMGALPRLAGATRSMEEAAGSIAFLHLPETSMGVSAVWRMPIRGVLQRLRQSDETLLESTMDSVDSNPGLRWLASDASLLMAPPPSGLAQVVLWRGEPGITDVLPLSLPAGTELRAAIAGPTSGAIVHLDGNKDIYLALVPTGDGAMVAFYITCIGSESIAICSREPPSVSGLGAEAGESIELISVEMVAELDPTASVVAATTVDRGDHRALVLRALDVTLSADVTQRDRADVSIPLEGGGVITGVEALATTLRNVGSFAGNDLVVAVAVETRSGGEIWATGARLCRMP